MARAQIVELPGEVETRQRTPGSPEAAVQHAEVYVVFTSPGETLAALRVASDLARSLGGQVHLVDFRVVPVGAPVERPTGRPRIEADGFLDRVRSEGIDVRADAYVCRDARRAIPFVFRAHSLVVIGGNHHRWPTRAERWRRILERHGHFVLMVDPANAGTPKEA